MLYSRRTMLHFKGELLELKENDCILEGKPLHFKGKNQGDREEVLHFEGEMTAIREKKNSSKIIFVSIFYRREDVAQFGLRE